MCSSVGKTALSMMSRHLAEARRANTQSPTSGVGLFFVGSGSGEGTLAQRESITEQGTRVTRINLAEWYPKLRARVAATIAVIGNSQRTNAFVSRNETEFLKLQDLKPNAANLNMD